MEETILSHTAIAWTDVLRVAEELGATHNHKGGCRSSDIFHAASALALGSRQFVTLDQKQAKLAKLAGLAVSPLGPSRPQGLNVTNSDGFA